MPFNKNDLDLLLRFLAKVRSLGDLLYLNRLQIRAWESELNDKSLSLKNMYIFLKNMNEKWN